MKVLLLLIVNLRTFNWWFLYCPEESCCLEVSQSLLVGDFIDFSAVSPNIPFLEIKIDTNESIADIQ